MPIVTRPSRKLLVACIALLALLSISPAVAYGDSTTDDPQKVPAERDIIGGFNIDISTAPWQVALFRTESPNANPFFDQFCGGSLIHAQWVLTAAHCLDGVTDVTTDMDIGVGETDLSKYTAAHRYDVAAAYVHPGWALTGDFTSDIALLKLTGPVTLGPNVAVIDIDYDPTAPAVDSVAFTSGWGAVDIPPNTVYPDNLQGTTLTVGADIQNDTCGGWFIQEFQAGMMTCAGDDDGVTSSCFGDSGGPLVNASGDPMLWGVVSFGFEECASATLPGVYVRVPVFRGWIAQYVPGIECDVTGTQGDDNLFGTNGNEIICGLGGNDYIVGYDGDDVLFGGGGNDDLRGGPGNDVLFGEGGKDAVRGNKGDDYLYGGKGDDLIAGQKGNDVAYGQGSDDEIFAGPGIDYVSGGPGDDFGKGGLESDLVFGGNGHDRLAGNDGNDFLDGGAGNDEIFGGSGTDEADGGSGTDRCKSIESPTSCEI